jgi:pyruvate,water dikinase
LRVEAALGGPQDVEWAQEAGGGFVLVQARPVTARQELPRGGEALWTRRFVGERWPHGATPLGWSLMEPLLGHFVGYPATSDRYLGGEPPFRLVRGHPYVNVTVLRHLAFKLPGAPPPRFLLDFFPPEEEARWLRRTAASPDLRVYASILGETVAERRWERFRWNPLTNPAAWDDFRTRLDGRLAELASTPPERALAVVGPTLRAYVGIHVTSLLYANLAWEILGPRLGEDAEALLQPDGEGTITARVNAELRALGALAVAEGYFLGAGGQPPATPPGSVASRTDAALAAFLAAHGHRSSASWEVWSPRWAEDPAAVLALARSMADGVAGPLPRDGGVDPTVSGVGVTGGGGPPPVPSSNASTSDGVSERLAKLPPGLRGATRLARTYLRLREEQRYHLDRVLWVLKQKLRSLGTRWLDDPEQVRFLTVGELGAVLEGHLAVAELRATVLRRAVEVLDPAPPDFLRGDAALPMPESGGTRWQGLGISPGVARGRVRVLRGPEEAWRLQAGEILVTSATDPGWTPLFARAGGLVLEMGSQLSHGAVVARELRLPAVANLPGATRRLRDGEEIVLDGRSGVVWRVG